MNKLKTYIQNIVFDSSKSRSHTLTVIKPTSGWFDLGFREMREYKDLFYFLVWRDMKVLYAQTILGFSWAVFNPLIQIAVFSIVFGRVAKLPSDGIPYVLFASVAIIPWTYMSQSMTASSQSLISGQNMLGKVYFPRLIFPLTPILAKLIDFTISVIILIVLFVYYKVPPTINILFLPIFLSLMVLLSAGVGMWLSALAIRFRDVKHAMPFVIRMLMYSAPVVYSASSIPEKSRIFYSINPLVGIIEGFRACFLGTPILWQFIWPGIITTLIIFFSGLIYFKRLEKTFVDVI